MWQKLASVMQESWEQLVVQAAHVLPNILASLLMVAVGAGVAVVVSVVARRTLVAARVDRAAARLGLAEALARGGIPSVPHLVARLLMWTIIIAASIPALYTLDARLASDLVGRALLYLPHVVVGAVLLWIGFLVSRFAARGVLIAAVNRDVAWPRLLATATRTAIMLLTVAVVLEHLGIGRATVLTAFAILFGGITLAAALAVGLGSRDLVRDWLAKHAQRDAAAGVREEPFRHW
jgi:hypothetical protein